MRRCRKVLQFGAGGGAQNPFANLMQPQAARNDPSRFDGQFKGSCPGTDPQAMFAMAEQLKRSMTPEMQQNLQSMMSSMSQGQQNFGKVGVMAFGMGENERGKKVARGAKLEYDPATGKMTKDFHEHQIDPDDPMLPKDAAVENSSAASAPCMEVEFEEDAADSKKSTGTAETLLESEVEIETPPTSSRSRT